ncbi:MAG TPA: ribose 5-phosphate isomerase B [Myxococcaceae bacterium]|nr:ribose 5-phosphate isomerase B [Myxococcaceae bacterium]
MRVVLGSDHAGFDMKQHLVELVKRLGHEVLDVGTHGPEPVDYPDFALAVAEAIRRGQADRGVLLCGSGVGASVALNKVPGLRGAVCHDTYSAHQGVEHDDMNVLVLGARIIGPMLADELVNAFLPARFTGEPRHLRRLDKVRAIEQRFLVNPGEAKERR